MSGGPLPQEELVAVFPSGLNFNKSAVAEGSPTSGVPPGPVT